MANKEFLDTRHDSELCRMRLYVTYSVSSETQTAITYSVSALAQVKSSTAGSIIRGDNSASWGMAISDSGGFYGGNCVTWDQVSAKNVTCSSANTWYTVYTFSAKSITIQKGSTTQSLLLYAPLDALINSGTYPKAYLDYNGSAIVSGIAKISYTVSYNANGGSGAPANQTKVYGEALKLSSTVPTKSGWTFAGWATSSSSSSVAYAAGASYTGNAALALYAVWKRVITVGYNANGGTNAPASQQVTIYNSATSGNITITTARPSRGNFAFLGWAGSSTATTVTHNPGSSYSFSSNTTLYAVWDAAPSISSLTVVRCDSNGDPADEGTYALVTCNWYLDGTLGDSATLSGTITPQSGGSATAFTFDSGDSGSGSVTATALISPVDPDMQYTVLVTAANGNNTSTRSAILTRAFFVMDWKAGGQAVGIGRAAPANGLEVGYETVFDDKVSVLGNLAVRASNIDRAETPSSETYSDTELILQGQSGTPLAFFDTARFTAGETVSRWVTFNQDSDSAEHFSIVEHVKPATSANNDGYINSQADIHLNHKKIYWKEWGYGDKFAITPYFNGADDANLLKIQSAVGAAGTDPALSDSVTISGKSGNVWVKGGLNVGSTARFQAQVINVVNGQRGTNPSATQYRTYEFHDTNGKRLSQVEAGLTNGNLNLLNLFVLGHFTSSDSYSGIQIRKTLNATGATTLVYDANTGQLSGINKLTFRTQLYYNATGTTGTVTLSSSAANYNHMRIYYRTVVDSYVGFDSVDVFSPNGKVVILNPSMQTNATNLTWWAKRATINGTSITRTSEGHFSRNFNDGSIGGSTTSNHIYIYRVEGWNE